MPKKRTKQSDFPIGCKVRARKGVLLSVPEQGKICTVVGYLPRGQLIVRDEDKPWDGACNPGDLERVEED
jgi:hypothetical protein